MLASDAKFKEHEAACVAVKNTEKLIFMLNNCQQKNIKREHRGTSRFKCKTTVSQPDTMIYDGMIIYCWSDKCTAN